MIVYCRVMKRSHACRNISSIHSIRLETPGYEIKGGMFELEEVSVWVVQGCGGRVIE